MTLHLHAWKQQAEVEGHHLLERHGGIHRLGLPAAEFGGDLHKARQDFLGHLHPGEFLASRIGIPDQGCHVEAEVADEGERVRGIDRQGRQYREDG